MCVCVCLFLRCGRVGVRQDDVCCLLAVWLCLCSSTIHNLHTSLLRCVCAYAPFLKKLVHYIFSLLFCLMCSAATGLSLFPLFGCVKRETVAGVLMFACFHCLV